MKWLDLEKYDSSKLSFDEQREIEGGVGAWAAYLAGVAIVVTTEIIQDWNGFKAGLAGKPEPAK